MNEKFIAKRKHNTSTSKSFKRLIIAQSDKPSKHEANEQVYTRNPVKGLKM